MNNHDKIQELVSKSKVGGNTAVEKLLKNFKLVIISQARAIYANGYDLDELIQIYK